MIILRPPFSLCCIIFLSSPSLILHPSPYLIISLPVTPSLSPPVLPSGFHVNIQRTESNFHRFLFAVSSASSPLPSFSTLHPSPFLMICTKRFYCAFLFLSANVIVYTESSFPYHQVFNCIVSAQRSLRLGGHDIYVGNDGLFAGRVNRRVELLSFMADFNFALCLFCC